MALRADVRESESYVADRSTLTLDAAMPAHQTSAPGLPSTDFRPSRGTGRFGRLAPPSGVNTEERLRRLRELGWSVEARECYRLARLEHRQILLFNDGRIVFKDPTIRGRHQYDREWLEVTAFMWPDLGF